MRIAIVNDVPLALAAISRVVERDPDLRIAWKATQGAEAVRLCRIDPPDLVLMDLFMPVMDGVEATRRIMALSPCPILVVTASVNDHYAQAFAAMSAGALDVVNTPILEWPDSFKGGPELLRKIATIRKIVRHEAASVSPKRFPFKAEVPAAKMPLVAVGASAGGPLALARIISCLPANLPAAVVVVQHVDGQFAPALANWLDDQSPLRVRLARDLERPAAGSILLAGGERHLVFVGPGTLGYREEPSDCVYRPSIDVFLHSIDLHWPGPVIGVLLTGMGSDGAKGLLSLRQRGHHTIIQSENTCAVYGMPKAAQALGAAAETLDLERIGLRLRALVSQPMRTHA